MAYTRTTWVDGSTPAINATNLNNIEQGLVDLHSGDITITGTKTFSGAVALNDVGKLYVGPQTYASDAALSVIEDGHAILYLIPNGSTETTMIRAWAAGGTWASRSAVAASRSLLQLDARGYSGSNYRAASRIELSTDDSGTFSDSSMPGKIVFSTTANSSTSLTERLRIDSAGKITVGTVGNGAGIALGSGGPTITSSNATPEAAITAPIGSKHRNTTTGIDFIKRTGTGNTGWVPTARVTVASTAPSSPVDGDIWIDSDPAWTDWTPSWSASTTDPTLTSVSGRYARYDNIVVGWGIVNITYANRGSGDYRVGLPVAPKQSSSYPRIGGAQLGQASQYMHMQMELYPSSNYGQLLGASTTTWSGLTFCNSTLITSPNTLSVSYWFMYEAA